MSRFLFLSLIVLFLSSLAGGQTVDGNVRGGGGDNPLGTGPASITSLNDPLQPPSPTIQSRNRPSGGRAGRR